jgi:hypothetical protein
MTVRLLFSAVIMFAIAAGCGGAPGVVSTPVLTDVSTVADGEALIEQGDIDGASNVFGGIVKDDPHNAQARF